MGFFHIAGQVFGQTSGYVLGEPIKIFGQVIRSDFIQEIGNGVQKVSEMTGKTFGDLGSGTVNTAKGIFLEKEQLRKNGLKELYSGMETIAAGFEATVIQTAENSKDVFIGLVDGDRKMLTKGTKKIIKTVVIGGIAVGLVDVLDGIDSVVTEEPNTELKDIPVTLEPSFEDPNYHISDEYIIQTINSSIEGEFHEETGVPFVKETIELPNGDTVTGVFPDFEEVIAISLPEYLYLESDEVQFEAANSFLSNKLESNPELQKQFTTEQLQQIQLGETPDSYIWHHHQIPGRLELVDEETHANTGHTGGRFMWGGGTEYR